MKIRIARHWWQRYVSGQPGKTMAEKEINAERIFHSEGRSWVESMNQSKGYWVTVETKYLFSSQFNIEDPNIRLDIDEADAICFQPEFKNQHEFFDAVQKRYDKDWPGSKIDTDRRRFEVLLDQRRIKIVPWSDLEKQWTQGESKMIQKKETGHEDNISKS